MKICRNLIIPVICSFLFSCTGRNVPDPGLSDTILVSDTIQYHPVRIRKSDGSILPWFSSDPGKSYDTTLMLVWHFWKNMETDSNGLKYYMNHQVWKPGHDMRGIGGDQVNMALSSWTLLYAYTGNHDIIDNMRYIADTYLERSLSEKTDEWPLIPYPYNTGVHSGKYDGDMRNGKGITQPDKAGSFGFELVNLYKITGDKKYLGAAISIAGTLMKHILPGDSLRSPLPFRVNAKTGEYGLLFNNNKPGEKTESALYTSNWTGTMQLFEQLRTLDQPNSEKYAKAFTTMLEWMKSCPLRLNKWGPFFEDIPGWSNTQTNAITFAWFIMNHRDLFPAWQKDVRGIIDWTYRELGNHEYEKYKVTVMNEQTVYRVPGNSHSSRQASVELLYTALSGDTSLKTNAIRTLNWATYTVASDGRNRYIRDDIWLTDGYGDYVRHYLRSMGAFPDLAPDNMNRLVNSTSLVTSIDYSTHTISYSIFDNNSEETLRLLSKPVKVTSGGEILKEQGAEKIVGWKWTSLPKGGILKICHSENNKVIIYL